MAHEKLDLRTHIRNPKTGQVVDVRPYRLHIASGTRYFEIPKGSGEFFFEDGSPVPKEKAPVLTPVVRLETEAQKLQKIRESIAAEHVELEKIRAEKAQLNGSDKAQEPVQASAAEPAPAAEAPAREAKKMGFGR